MLIGYGRVKRSAFSTDRGKNGPAERVSYRSVPDPARATLAAALPSSSLS
jgi:hypothetical protein